MYKIRCIRFATSLFGAREGYLKGVDGEEKRFLTLEDAEAELARVQQIMGSNPNLQYRVEELP